MPSEMILKEKQEYVNKLAGELGQSVSGVIASYKGISVADDTKLRRELREAGVDYRVVKNTMLHRAAEQAGIAGLDDVLAGSTALATCNDHTTAARILCKYAETSKTFEIKAGFVEGKAINAASVDQLAKMPSKEVLVAKALGGLNAPITGFVYVLNANLSGLARVLSSIAEKKA